MNKLYKFAAVGIAVLMTVPYSWAQDDEDEKAKGRFTASFETNTTVYVKDDKVGATYPEDHVGSNNYLKLDYIKGRFAVGMQMESYLPVLQGFPARLDTTKVTIKYVSWTDKSFSVTAGDFYDQFGNGLIFRSWEDRALGFNNSLEGARVTYNWDNKVAIKAIWGRPRMYMGVTHTQIRGFDGIFSISNMLDWYNHSLSIEGSYLNKYSRLSDTELGEFVNKPSVDSYSARLNYEVAGFSLRTEFAGHSEDMFMNASGTEVLLKKGSAQFAEIGYSGNGLGVLLTVRRLEYMDNKIRRLGAEADNNNINYLPALTQEFAYMLANLHPYAGTPDNEIGGQFDLFYNFKRGSALGGKRGMKVHLNYSRFQSLDKDMPDNVGIQKNVLYYQGVTFDIEKWWNRKLKTTLLYSFQEYNPSYGFNDYTEKRHIVVGDVTYRFTNKTSMRAELQYLATEAEEGDWVAGLIEFNFAPNWSIFFSDMYNHGNEGESVSMDDEGNLITRSLKLNYYNAGVSYTRSKTRIAVSYGRNREGYICSGGVCRKMPAYTGVNINMSIAF